MNNLRARPRPFSAFSGTFNFIPYRISRKTGTRFCIICIMRSMEADSFEHQRVTHIKVPVGNRLCTPGFHGDLQTTSYHKFLIIRRLQQIPGIQWVACRTVPVTGAGAVLGGRVPHNAPFPLQYGGLSYRFRCGWGIGRPLKHTDSGAIRGKKVP